jgi:hypothetical protein
MSNINFAPPTRSNTNTNTNTNLINNNANANISTPSFGIGAITPSINITGLTQPQTQNNNIGHEHYNNQIINNTDNTSFYQFPFQMLYAQKIMANQIINNIPKTEVIRTFIATLDGLANTHKTQGHNIVYCQRTNTQNTMCIASNIYEAWKKINIHFVNICPDIVLKNIYMMTYMELAKIIKDIVDVPTQISQYIQKYLTIDEYIDTFPIPQINMEYIVEIICNTSPIEVIDCTFIP